MGMNTKTIPFYIISVFLILGSQVHAVTHTVGSGKTFESIKSAIMTAKSGDTVLVSKGIYKEGNIIIDKAICLIGEHRPVLDGEYKHEIISIKNDSVTIKGFRIQNSSRNTLDDSGGIKAYDSNYLLIEENELHENYFGIYIQYGKYCVIKSNIITSTKKSDSQSGNGIHCWKSDSLQICGNLICGHRDGIYFEFVSGSVIWRNVAKNNARYGLHFMFSHNDSYITNYFKANGAGVAVMFSKHVYMMNNTFEENRGDAAYGVLFKEISDCYLAGNKFLNNTTGIFFDGSNRIEIERNIFQGNGWGMRMQANCMDNYITHNNFLGNTFDVTTNGSLTLNHFEENYWDRYEGYDLNKDNIGDVPYHPLSLYSVIVEKNPPAMLLYRSFMISLLDKSEKIIPTLTPENFVDNHPLTKALKL